MVVKNIVWLIGPEKSGKTYCTYQLFGAKTADLTFDYAQTFGRDFFRATRLADTLIIDNVPADPAPKWIDLVREIIDVRPIRLFILSHFPPPAVIAKRAIMLQPIHPESLK